MAKIGQDFQMWAGDHMKLIFTVDDVESLEGTTIRWEMAKRATAEPLITKSSANDDIDINGNTFTVSLSPEDTTDIRPKSNYYHEAEVVDGADGSVSTVATGTMRVNTTLI